MQQLQRVESQRVTSTTCFVTRYDDLYGYMGMVWLWRECGDRRDQNTAEKRQRVPMP